jgi:hypothetical protein
MEQKGYKKSNQSSSKNLKFSKNHISYRPCPLSKFEHLLWTFLNLSKFESDLFLMVVMVAVICLWVGVGGVMMLF